MGKTRDLFKKIRDTKGTFHEAVAQSPLTPVGCHVERTRDGPQPALWPTRPFPGTGGLTGPAEGQRTHRRLPRPTDQMPDPQFFPFSSPPVVRIWLLIQGKGGD